MVESRTSSLLEWNPFYTNHKRTTSDVPSNSQRDRTSRFGNEQKKVNIFGSLKKVDKRHKLPFTKAQLTASESIFKSKNEHLFSSYKKNREKVVEK